jgi:hypothetical protein
VPRFILNAAYSEETDGDIQTITGKKNMEDEKKKPTQLARFIYTWAICFCGMGGKAHVGGGAGGGIAIRGMLFLRPINWAWLLEEDEGLEGRGGRGPVGGGESGGVSAMMSIGRTSPGTDHSEKADAMLARLGLEAHENPREKLRVDSPSTSTEVRFLLTLSPQAAAI